MCCTGIIVKMLCFISGLSQITQHAIDVALSGVYFISANLIWADKRGEIMTYYVTRLLVK